MITQYELKNLVSYNPETGIFTRLVSTSSNANVGNIAGYISGNGYKYFSIKNKEVLAHRMAWIYVYGELNGQIDHINRDRSDNRICNLRVINQSENNRNMPIKSHNTTGYPGVSFRKDTGKYRSTIHHNGKSKSLGCFETAYQAFEAYKTFHNENYGHIRAW